MSDPSDQEAEYIERCKVLCSRILEVIRGADEREARSALVAALTRLSLQQTNPDRAMLESLDAALGLFREMSNTKYRNEDPAVS